MPRLRVHLDFETRSCVDLVTQGVYRYSEDPSTEIMCFAYRIGTGPVEGFDHPNFQIPEDLLAAIDSGAIIVAHNSVFERLIWNRVLRRFYQNLPELTADNFTCTMARAAAVGMPQGLDRLCRALKLRVEKDMIGHRLMMKMCKPVGFSETGEPLWHDSPQDRERLLTYCKYDVLAEDAADAVLPELTPEERQVWLLDQKINDRGVPLDREAAERADNVVQIAKKRANRRMWELTGGAVSACTKVKAIVTWLVARGYVCDSIADEHVTRLLIETQAREDTVAEQVLICRRSAGKSSTSKLDAALRSVSADGRMRGMLRYHGAGPGRWSGQLFQPHNILRVDQERDAADVALVFDLLDGRSSAEEIYDFLISVYGDAMTPIAKSMRGMICSDTKLRGGDFSNIEGRISAWLARETWKVEAFEAYDAGTGPDLYKVAYANSFGIPVDEVNGAQRQIGKVEELALGFQGAVGAFISMGANYGVKPRDVAAAVYPVVSRDAWSKAWSKFGKGFSTFGLEQPIHTGLQVVVDLWRDAHPNVVERWWEIQDAAIDAVMHPGRIVPCVHGRVRYMVDRGFLWCSLPSGRTIAYAYPRIVGDGGPNKDQRQVEFTGVDSQTKRWRDQRLYGGLQWNNIVQGTARDLLVFSIFALKAEGYKIILTVHDENVDESEEELRRSLAHFSQVMERRPVWAAGLPVAVKVWEDRRFGK